MDSYSITITAEFQIVKSENSTALLEVKYGAVYDDCANAITAFNRCLADLNDLVPTYDDMTVTGIDAMLSSER